MELSGSGSGRPGSESHLQQQHQDLLVFGYACKLYRDDEKAALMESGKHLIPWMGQDCLMIDRYDGRGALYELDGVEAKPSYDLTKEELEEERVCDYERYRSLMGVDDEEPERPVSHASYAQVGYTYQEEDAQGPGEEVEEDEEEDDSPWVAPRGLVVPEGMVVPGGAKHGAIIAKTAAFIASQGSQMEVLVKLKQANNPQFDFLAHTHSLHPYYKLLLQALKSGSLRLEPEAPGVQGLRPETADAMRLAASYVARLGPSFEKALIRRLDPRLEFLNPHHPSHSLYRTMVDKAKPSQSPSSSRSSQPSQPPHPVCFSIRRAKDSEPLDIPSALHTEDSDSDTSLTPNPAPS